MRILGTICGQRVPSALEIDGDTIESLKPAGARAKADLGGRDVLIAPALLDLQVNGFEGHDLNGDDVSADEVSAIAGALHRRGVGMFCPTVCTGAFAQMAASLKAVAAACADKRVEAAVAGVHIEGPYISSEDGPRGAHPRDHTRDPNWDEFSRFQEAAGGHIRIVTLAPERPGAIRFIERLAAAGVVPAIGHTGASADEIRAAVRAGARLSTHLGNGAHALIPRHPNYIWEQLAADELWASIIADGHHLPPAVVKCMVRCKGPARTILVSDAVHLAGCPPGEYEFGGRAVELTPEGKVQLKGTPYLAGAALELARGVANAVRFAGVSLAEAVGMATLNPARLLGMDDRFGSVGPGREASLILFRWHEGATEMEISHTILRGEVVFKAS
jgi:N-acetylglucosamine-6-phosphate deacetylase